MVGASEDPSKLGYAVARNLAQGGFPGAVHFVNPKGGKLFGRSICPRLADVPDPVDLAVLIVPAGATPSTLQEVGKRGIHAAIIASGGFREVGPSGAELEEECLAVARQNSIRLIGPNCIGLIDLHLPLDTSFLAVPPPPKGNVAFISQSGAVIGAIVDWVRDQGIGFSRLISLGNQADVSEVEMMSAVVEDENTRVLALYIESIRDGQLFKEVIPEVARCKPVVALKVGRSEGGRKAAASHTGALAGREAAYEAAFRQSGILRAGSMEELFDWAAALTDAPLPQGNRIAVLTNAGGPGVIASDALEMHGLCLAELSPETEQGLAARLPAAASLSNPVDMLGGATHEMYASCLRLLIEDPGVDGVLVILPPPPADSAEADAAAMIPLISSSPKPVLVALMGGPAIQSASRLFRKSHVPEYRFPERAVSAFGALVARAGFLRRKSASAPQLPAIDREYARAVSEGLAPGVSQDAGVIRQLLSAYDIPSVPSALAGSAKQAVEIAAQMGFPVVLKIASPDLPHKSDVRGILLNVRTPQEIFTGYEGLVRRVHAVRPDARIEGVLVQPMEREGQEVIVGVVRDRQFGPLVMFGSGGVEVEGLKDVAFALPPLDPEIVDDLLQRTWAGRRLKGFRGQPAADWERVQKILVCLAQLTLDFPAISEIEINPLRVFARGAMALDIRMRWMDENER